MRKICVVTATRAEYGLLYWLMKDLQQASDVELQLVVAGAHLSPEHGNTWTEIVKDGFQIDARVKMLLASDTPLAIAKSMGLGTMGFADAFERLSPDIVILLGDRYETLSAAQAAIMMNIPIAHLYGGEATEGAVDEAIRHAITKLSHIHFVATDAFADRVKQMGENPDHVFTVGAAGLDNIDKLAFLSRPKLEQELNLKLSSPFLLVTYHPVTLADDPVKLVDELLSSLKGFPSGTIIFTGTNADANGRAIAKRIDEFADARPGSVHQFTSLGALRYLSAMDSADVVVGNSSSGLLEAPAMGTPTVNIGSRQQGRPRAPSIIDCEEDAASITAAINEALSPEYKSIAERRETPYGTPGAAGRINRTLLTINLDGILMKRFHSVAIDV